MREDNRNNKISCIHTDVYSDCGPQRRGAMWMDTWRLHIQDQREGGEDADKLHG
jgi:hypothetical protein